MPIIIWIGGQIAGQTLPTKRNMDKIFLWRLPFSIFLAKTLRINKIAMKSFSKNLSFGVDFKL